MVPVSEAISQWKWNFYNENGNSLSYFGIIGAASRGTWASCEMLWRLRWKYFVSLGAILYSIGLLTSPITQQMIAYPLRNVSVTGEASLPLSRVYSLSDLEIQVSTVSALVQQASNFTKPFDALCSTGHCTFERYNSIAICSQAKDITKHLSFDTIKN
ncbi:hypothetical protein GQ53DRAFT_597421, partial [Thozetella sp. PMI_491]